MGNSKKLLEATRAERKAKKRKLEDAIPDVPGDEDRTVDEELSSKTHVDKKRVKRSKQRDLQQDFVEGLDINEGARQTTLGLVPGQGDIVSAAPAEFDKAARSDKDRTNDVSVSLQSEKGGSEEALGSIGDSPVQSAPRKSKKERKVERRAKEAAEQAAIPLAPGEEPSVLGTGTVVTVVSSAPKSRKNNRNREKKREGKATNVTDRTGGKNSRFIVFIGNLPYSATTESVTKHFAAVKPKSVRHLTRKDDPSKSKGIAFVEFDGYDHMKTCLKLFHHSNFDDGISPPRKINVELTAGGGGNTSERRVKIKEKNEKLNDQRSRKIQEEEKAKWEKRKEAGTVDESAIHPSRRARVPGV